MREQNFVPGILKPELHELLPITDRLTFIYLEHCIVSREDGAFTCTYSDGVVNIPSCAVAVMLIGPGVDFTSKAMSLVGDSATTLVWVGEHGVRYYAHGRALSSHTGYLEKQATLFSNTRLHLSVVRKMYSMRFPGEDVSSLTLQQLRGREGSRMKKVYRKNADKWGISWEGRNYDFHDYHKSDLVNQALSAGNVCLYGLATAVIVSLGCAPGLGFVHVGHELSFAYDIADLYKAEYTIPLAFELAYRKVENIEAEMRHSLRDMFAKNHLVEQMVKDLKTLLEFDDNNAGEPLYLWDNLKGLQKYGILYEEKVKNGSADDDMQSSEISR